VTTKDFLFMGEVACGGPRERHSPGPNLALNGPGISVYRRGSLLDGLAMYLSCDTKKFHDNESTHILHNFWTSTYRGEASPLPPWRRHCPGLVTNCMWHTHTVSYVIPVKFIIAHIHSSVQDKFLNCVKIILIRMLFKDSY